MSPVHWSSAIEVQADSSRHQKAHFLFVAQFPPPIAFKTPTADALQKRNASCCDTILCHIAAAAHASFQRGTSVRNVSSRCMTSKFFFSFFFLNTGTCREDPQFLQSVFIFKSHARRRHVEKGQVRQGSISSAISVFRHFSNDRQSAP